MNRMSGQSPFRLLEATPLAMCRLALWGFIAVLVTHTAADADLWGHLRFGLDMFETGELHSSDPYSFTSDRPWINHEWLAEVLMAAVYIPLGSPGLILLKLVFIGVIASLLFVIARQEGANPVARDIFIAMAVFVTYTRTQVVRPQLFSVALFCVVLYLLRECDRGRMRLLWLLPFCFVAWVNLHGGWLVGLGALGVWLAGEAWRRRKAAEIAVLAVVGVLSAGATLLNPYGYGLWNFLAETVRPERPDITDWKPLLELPAGILLIEAVLPIAAMAALWRARRCGRIGLRDCAVLTLLAAATVRVGRVDAFLQAAIAILLAGPLIRMLNELEVRVPLLLRRGSAPVGVVALLLFAYLSVTVVQNVRAVRIQGDWLPDPAAAMFLRDTRPGARVLTWFDWGEYGLWHLSPAAIRISMDGRRETVYSEQVIGDHNRFYEGHPEMVDYPDRIGADHVWLPSRFRMVHLLTERGWIRLLDTGTSVVLAREGTPVHYRAVMSTPATFPWP
jgi:hypothetical protein